MGVPPQRSQLLLLRAVHQLMQPNSEEVPLHVFERATELPMDAGMSLCGAANAGVELGAVGGATLQWFPPL